MEIKRFYLPYYINEKNGKWYGCLDVNRSRDTFKFYIENEELEWKIRYEESPFSKEETDELFQEALKNEKIKKLLDKTVKLVTKVEELKSLENEEIVPINIVSYQLNDWAESFDFMIGQDSVKIGYSIHEDGSISSFASPTDEGTTAEERVTNPSIRDFNTHLSEKLNEKIIEQIRNHPKVKLRRLLAGGLKGGN